MRGVSERTGVVGDAVTCNFVAPCAIASQAACHSPYVRELARPDHIRASATN